MTEYIKYIMYITPVLLIATFFIQKHILNKLDLEAEVNRKRMIKEYGRMKENLRIYKENLNKLIKEKEYLESKLEKHKNYKK